MVMSAVSSVSTPGVLVTVMPRLRRRLDIDIVDAGAEIGDQLELLGPAWSMHRAVDAVGDGRHQHVRLLDGVDQLGLAHRPVVDVEARVEQLAHAGFDRRRAACA